MKTVTVEEVETKPLSIRRIIAALDLAKQCEATSRYAAQFARHYGPRLLSRLLNLDKVVRLACEALCPVLVYREPDN